MNLVVLGDVDMSNQAGVSKHQVDRECCKQVLVQWKDKRWFIQLVATQADYIVKILADQE